MSPNEYLRASQITKIYPISQSTLWRYSKLGLLQPTKVTNGVTVFLRSELEAFFSGKSLKEAVNE